MGNHCIPDFLGSGELFADPVVTRCGHCFCRDCVVGHPKAACPACDAPMAPVALKPSKKMQDIVEVIRQLLVSLSEESALGGSTSRNQNFTLQTT